MHSLDATYCNKCHTSVLLTWMCRAKMAEPIDLLFGGWLMWA